MSDLKITHLALDNTLSLTTTCNTDVILKDCSEFGNFVITLIPFLCYIVSINK